jgi:hypothetical protein
MTHPPDRDRGPAQHTGRRPPDYVIVAWASQQLRDRAQRTALSLADALRAEQAQHPGPQPDREADPAPRHLGEPARNPQAAPPVDHDPAARLRSAGEPVSAARSAECPCRACAGAPCRPDGDHLARYLRAWQAGTLSREALKHAIDGLDVIAAQAIVPAPPGHTARPGAAAAARPAGAEAELEPG